MSSQSLRLTLYDRLQATMMSYLHVDHPSTRRVHQGQMLIILQTLLLIPAWGSFLSYIPRLATTFRPTALENAIYWGVTLTQLALMAVPIALARKGRVTLGANFLLVMTTIGLIKFAIARGYPVWGQLTVAALMFVIPLAGALINSRASFFAAIILASIELTLSLLFDPKLPRFLLTSMLWLTFNFGLLMWGILWLHEHTTAVIDKKLKLRKETLLDEYRDEFEEIGWNVALDAHRQMTLPLETLRARLNALEDRERDHLSAAGRDELYAIQTSIGNLLDEWASGLEVHPSGAVMVPLRAYDAPIRGMLDRFSQTGSSDESMRVRVRHDPSAPSQVRCAPAALRYAIRDCLYYLSARSSEIEMVDLLEDDCWVLRMSHHAGRTPAEKPSAGALHRARTRMRAMNGSVTLEGSHDQPSALVIAIPLRRID